jgi:Uncharacterized protein conserved in bacteria (DUF2213)
MYLPPKVKPSNSLFVTNEQAKRATRMMDFVWNMLPAGCRLETLEDKTYTVVPMVMMTEGVHSGSQGAFFYPKDELSKTPVVWNHKPVVVYHPEMNGRAVSACDATIINSRKVGVIMNAKVEGGKLKAEAWIDRTKADKVDKRIGEAIDKNEVMELSTGVFVDVDQTPGEWNGEAYTGIAVNYRPDHLALLPDQIGACSVNDGAGFMRNAAKSKDAGVMAAIKTLQKAGLIANDQSFSDIQSQVSTALRDRFNATGDNAPFLWVMDVFQNFAVYEFDGKLFRLGYSASETTGVTLSPDAPVEVVRKTQYQPVPAANAAKDPTTNRIMEKKKLVDAIIANEKSGWAETDRDALMAFNENRLNVILNGCKPEATPATNKQEPAPAPVPANVAPIPGVTVPVTNKEPEQKKPITINEFVAAAPAEMQDVLRNSLRLHEDQKAKLVATITANKQCGYTKAELEGKPMEELEKLARLAAAPAAPATVTPFYGGMAPVPVDNSQPEEALPIPVMNFDKK